MSDGIAWNLCVDKRVCSRVFQLKSLGNTILSVNEPTVSDNARPAKLDFAHFAGLHGLQIFPQVLIEMTETRIAR